MVAKQLHVRGQWIVLLQFQVGQELRPSWPQTGNNNCNFATNTANIGFMQQNEKDYQMTNGKLQIAKLTNKFLTK